MAKIPHPTRPTRSRKRHRNTGIAALPLRRSVRIAHRTIFRFNDLAPELRNAIYSLVLGTNNAIQLTRRLPATAKALSQVSRIIRAESLSTYYSVNSFKVVLHYWSPDEAQRAVSCIEEWHDLFGNLAARHVRTLSVEH